MNSFIRLAQAEDAQAIQAIYAPNVSGTVISFEIAVPSVEMMRQRIEKTLQVFPWLVCEEDGEIAGYAYASSHRERLAYQWSVDVSVYTHTNYRRRGIGRALYTSLFSLLCLQGFFNAYAGIALPNPASIALHEAMGMHSIGAYSNVGYKLGAWHDVGWWEAVLQPHAAEPVPPLSVAQAMALEGWEEALSSGLRLIRD